MFYNAQLTHNIYGKYPPFEKISIYDLYFLLCKSWKKETCAPRLRDKFSNDNLTVGQCSITAILVQNYYGGEIYGIPLLEGGYHCFNVIDGIIFDLTSEQFKGEQLNYSLDHPQNKAKHFQDREKLNRYNLLSSTLVAHIR